MNVDRLWNYKNFHMVAELDIAGEFIYNGIHEIYSLSFFSNDGPTFCALYNISVGIERLQKIICVLWGMDSYGSDEEFEESLITHSHTGLRDRIKQFLNEFNVEIQFNARENDFFSVMQGFYNHARYTRFNVDGKWNEEFVLIRNFALKYNLVDEMYDFEPGNSLVATPKMKEIMGRTIGSISKKYYDLIVLGSNKNSTYSYEIRAGSKAERVFLGKKEKNSLMQAQIDESVALKELLVFYRKTDVKDPFFNFVDEIEPLDFDPVMVAGYLEDVIRGDIPQVLIDDVECMYEDYDNIGDRIQLMSAFANSSVIYDYPHIKEAYSIIERIIINKSVQDNDIEMLSKCKDYIYESEISDQIGEVQSIISLYTTKQISVDDLYTRLCSIKENYKHFLIGENEEALMDS